MKYATVANVDATFSILVFILN